MSKLTFAKLLNTNDEKTKLPTMGGKTEFRTLYSVKYLAPIEYLPWILHLALENQAYTPIHQLVAANFEFLGKADQQFQWVEPRRQLNLYQPLLELKQLKPMKETRSFQQGHNFL